MNAVHGSLLPKSRSLDLDLETQNVYKGYVVSRLGVTCIHVGLSVVSRDWFVCRHNLADARALF